VDVVFGFFGILRDSIMASIRLNYLFLDGVSSNSRLRGMPNKS